MKRRSCSRRFIGSRRRYRGLLPSSSTAQEPSRHAHASEDPQSAPRRTTARPRIRSRVTVALGALVILGSLTAALCLPALSHNPRSLGHRFEGPPLDHLIWWESFSEVEQTRGILRGLSLQAIAEIRRVYLIARSTPAPLPHDGATRNDAIHDPALITAIDAVRRRLVEFHGTDDVLPFQCELLRLLRKAGHHQEWLNLYLELTYRHPNNPLIPMESARAADAARFTGREPELREALDHWNQIPKRYRASVLGSDPWEPAPWTEPILP